MINRPKTKKSGREYEVNANKHYLPPASHHFTDEH